MLRTRAPSLRSVSPQQWLFAAYVAAVKLHVCVCTLGGQVDYEVTVTTHTQKNGMSIGMNRVLGWGFGVWTLDCPRARRPVGEVSGRPWSFCYGKRCCELVVWCVAFDERVGS